MTLTIGLSRYAPPLPKSMTSSRAFAHQETEDKYIYAHHSKQSYHCTTSENYLDKTSHATASCTRFAGRACLDTHPTASCCSLQFIELITSITRKAPESRHVTAADTLSKKREVEERLRCHFQISEIELSMISAGCSTGCPHEKKAPTTTRRPSFEPCRAG